MLKNVDSKQSCLLPGQLRAGKGDSAFERESLLSWLQSWTTPMTTAETGGSCCTQLLAWASTSQVSTLLLHVGMLMLGPHTAGLVKPVSGEPFACVSAGHTVLQAARQPQAVASLSAHMLHSQLTLMPGAFMQVPSCLRRPCTKALQLASPLWTSCGSRELSRESRSTPACR